MFKNLVLILGLLLFVAGNVFGHGLARSHHLPNVHNVNNDYEHGHAGYERITMAPNNFVVSLVDGETIRLTGYHKHISSAEQTDIFEHIVNNTHTWFPHTSHVNSSSHGHDHSHNHDLFRVHKHTFTHVHPGGGGVRVETQYEKITRCILQLRDDKRSCKEIDDAAARTACENTARQTFIDCRNGDLANVPAAPSMPDIKSVKVKPSAKSLATTWGSLKKRQ